MRYGYGRDWSEYPELQDRKEYDDGGPGKSNRQKPVSGSGLRKRQSRHPASSLIKIAETLEIHPAKLFGMQTADEQFEPDATLRIFNAEDRRTIAGILVMNGYTTRHIKVAREGKKSSWYCIQAMLEESNLGSQ